jgi:hypothetical protein
MASELYNHAQPSVWADPATEVARSIGVLILLD